ncbi:MAG: hypothetical protein CVU42_07445 [Chloroflexi bacterium HGW-Chloroflexi-4]|jgi:hypothetical protein|nr:MAG: hypothetical protein CVU42_07445 [Chloroflexi bacterium HGW-Chloroflexi-4]
MEVTLEKEKQSSLRKNRFVVISQAIFSAINKLTSCITMTKVDRFKAGINTSGEGREDQSIFD